jgi:hypothetical protein
MGQSRRTFLETTLAGAGLIGLGGRVHAAEQTATPAPATAPTTAFPTQDPTVVREVVGVSHNNLERVKELVERQPSLARAAYDWGFGDWEDALGAASHVGRRDIAEYLISKGARPTIFSAAMLGHLDTVKAFVAAMPGVQRTLGPHGITLLAHARNGGEQARPVLGYLGQLGDADPRLESPTLTDAEATALAGTYVFGAGPSDRIVIETVKGNLAFTRMNTSRRGLLQRGPREFSPVGAPSVRIRFAGDAGRAATLTVHDPDVVLTARRDGS